MEEIDFASLVAFPSAPPHKHREGVNRVNWMSMREMNRTSAAWKIAKTSKRSKSAFSCDCKRFINVAIPLFPRSRSSFRWAALLFANWIVERLHRVVFPLWPESLTNWMVQCAFRFVCFPPPLQRIDFPPRSSREKERASAKRVLRAKVFMINIRLAFVSSTRTFILGKANPAWM